MATHTNGCMETLSIKLDQLVLHFEEKNNSGV
jgi:hypothetical protein